MQAELASERELRQRTEADASQASQCSERQISELSEALAAVAADVTAARQACLESEARAEAQQVSDSDASAASQVSCYAPALLNALHAAQVDGDRPPCAEKCLNNGAADNELSSNTPRSVGVFGERHGGCKRQCGPMH